MERTDLDTAIILAGGLGTRLRSVIKKVPKPMAPVQGRPFLLYLLEYWHRQGIRRFILSVGYKSSCIQKGLKALWHKSDLEFVKENKPHGTGGALLYCLKKKKIESPFLLLNGDTFFAVNLKKLHQHARKTKADWCLSLFSSKDYERYLPVKLKKDFSIKKLVQKKVAVNKTANYLSNGGVYWIHPRGIRHVRCQKRPLSLEEEILSQTIEKRFRVVGFPSKGIFIDIGIPADFNKAQSFLFQ